MLAFATLGDAELRDAADLAAGLLVIDDARLYGLMRGGPDIDRARCEAALAMAAERGYVPDAVQARKAAVELASEMATAPPEPYVSRKSIA